MIDSSPESQNTRLSTLNAMPEDLFRRELTACCGSRRWLEEMAARRPFADPDELFSAAEAAADELQREDWQESFSHHPRLGDVASLRQRFGARSGAWSQGEQAGLSTADEETLARLAEGNRLYEKRFGYIFLLCAGGKGAAEILDALEIRLTNPAEIEHEIAASEQRKITRLRLRKWLRGER